MSGNYDGKKKTAIVTFVVLLLVAAVAVVVIGIMTSDFTEEEEDLFPTAKKKKIEAFCQPTHYKKECVKKLESSHTKRSTPRALAHEAYNATRAEIASALAKFKPIKDESKDPRASHAIEICQELAKYSVRDLERAEHSFDRFGKGDFEQFVEDLSVWTGGAMAYLEVCLDGFHNTTDGTGEKVKSLLLESRELVANALAIVEELDVKWNNIHTPKGEHEGKEGHERVDRHNRTASNNEGEHRRRLLSLPLAGQLPEWISDEKRNILGMEAAAIKADVVVAKDGSGKVRTIRQALHFVPKKNTEAFVIHIKEGVYREHVTISGRLTSIILVGDGPNKTIISGERSFSDDYPTYKTATIEVYGDGFMARDIGFENTAAPSKHQAVAARVSSDYTMFYHCHFTGFYNTLFVVRSRQFFRDCTIFGSVDFIFGDALAVFQNSHILIRDPVPGRNSTVTAQARDDENGPGAFIFHNCTITSAPGTDLAQNEGKAYLGRPWKPYSRTVVMQSFIDKTISPKGWVEMDGNAGLKTSFFAEYMNLGPGSNDSSRVKWEAVKKLTPEQAIGFTPGKFYAGTDKWITNTGCPYYANMLPT